MQIPRTAVFVVGVALGGCGGNVPVPVGGVGESCTRRADCADGLKCIENQCGTGVEVPLHESTAEPEPKAEAPVVEPQPATGVNGLTVLADGQLAVGPFESIEAYCAARQKRADSDELGECGPAPGLADIRHSEPGFGNLSVVQIMSPRGDGEVFNLAVVTQKGLFVVEDVLSTSWGSGAGIVLQRMTAETVEKGAKRVVRVILTVKDYDRHERREQVAAEVWECGVSEAGVPACKKTAGTG